MKFRGNFEHSLDAKHRLTVPAKYREALSGGVVIAVSPATKVNTPKCVGIWIPEVYDQYVEGALADRNPMSPEARELSRAFNANSWDTELDSANRLMLPPFCVSYAGLVKEVTVTGSGTHLEVWDRTSFSKYNAGLLDDLTSMTARVDHTA